jgi:hypothetical protein
MAKANETDYARKCQQLDVLIDLLERENKRLREMVVYCKECKHRDPEDKKCDCGHGIEWQSPRQDDWYCADGERSAT